MKYISILFLATTFSCNVVMDKHVEGNGASKKETRNITGFSHIAVSGNFEVTLQQGDGFKVELEADANLLSYIETRKHDLELEINEKGGYNLDSKHPIKIFIQMPKVDEISMSGAGIIKGSAAIENSDKLELNIGGSGEMELQVKSPKIDLEIGGSGKATLTGSTRDFKVSIGGSGDCLAEELLSENCKISIGGSGTARVYASVKLNASIGGSGDVYYGGTPTVTQSVGGSGSIQPIK